MNIYYICTALNFITAMIWLRLDIKGNKIVAGIYLLLVVLGIVLGAIA